MTRRCSHCSHNGHNSRTCPNRGVKIFGVRLTDGLIRKSASMGNLSHCTGSTSGSNLNGGPLGSGSPGDAPDHGDGYASEDFASASREKKKGIPWTEEEHRMFLLGLQKLGKGDWRGISRTYVISRTPTQVASHAQKYFIRQSNVSRRKRRSSLFDIVADESVEMPMETLQENHLNHQRHADSQSSYNLPTVPSPQVSAVPSPEEENESMDSATNSNDGDASLPRPESTPIYYPVPVIVPAYVSPVFPFSVPYWPGNRAAELPETTKPHVVLKPTAVQPKSPINVDELLGMSKLSLGVESNNEAGPSGPLSLKLSEGSSRQSAFHANPAPGRSTSSNPIHAL
uniref:Uncharacterized protein n=1 Tax=Kalanchoe fedtschenkoi TaxID=63787 RepID=A0A7N0VL02_KALFE